MSQSSSSQSDSLVLSSSNQKSFDLLRSKAFAIWPWFTQEKCSEWTDEDNDEFYAFTYGKDWGEKIAEGFDEDETSRLIYVYKLCEKFELNGKSIKTLDGSKKTKTRISNVWKKISQEIYKNNIKGDGLRTHYIQFPTNTWELNATSVSEVYSYVFENDPEEFVWLLEYIYRWILDDKHRADKLLADKKAKEQSEEQKLTLQGKDAESLQDTNKQKVDILNETVETVTTTEVSELTSVVEKKIARKKLVRKPVPKIK